MALKILYISDIHFRAYKENTDPDLDTDIQNELKLDLKALMTDLGKSTWF